MTSLYDRNRLPVKKAAFFLHPGKVKTILASLAILLLSSELTSGQTCDSVSFIRLQPADFLEKLKGSSNALLIDVREPFEYKKFRIDPAINLPASGKIDLAADTMNRTYHCFLYCTSGFRSDRVAKRLTEKGFLFVYSLEGGINRWEKDGLPVSKKKLKKK
jgi:rhodanese-related sulfurtransferase